MEEKIHQKNHKLKVAQNQLEELESEMKKALSSSEEKLPIMVDPKTLNTLVSYLEHLNYIHQFDEEGGEVAGLPPQVPSHLRSKNKIEEI